MVVLYCFTLYQNKYLKIILLYYCLSRKWVYLCGINKPIKTKVMSVLFTDYSNKVIDGQMCIWLQSYGWAPAKQMKDVKIGDICICNYGITEKIVGIAKETAKTIAFKYECSNGKIIDGRPRRKDTYIAIKK